MIGIYANQMTGDAAVRTGFNRERKNGITHIIYAYMYMPLTT